MQITESLSEAKASGAKISEPKADISKSSKGRPKQMSEEDMLEFIGNWKLLSIYTLSDIPGVKLTVESISSRVGISKAEAESGIEALIRLGVFEPNVDSQQFDALPLVFDDSIVPSADLLSIFNRLSGVSKTKLTSKDCFGHIFEAMDKKVILKYLPEIYSLVQRVKEESKGSAGSEVYAFEFSFTKATRIKKSELT